MARASAVTKGFGQQLGQASTGMATMGKVGRGLRTAMADPFAAMATPVGMTALAIVGASKAAIDFKSDWAGVTKTVDGTPAQMAAIKQGIRDMSKEMPAATSEIAAVAEAAGQLGIQTDSVLGFSRVMIDLGNTTNLSSEMGADALARFANITQMSQKQFSNLGSTVVELGNKYASTEAEIVDFSVRMAGAGAVAGMTEADIMAIATAFSSVGVESERGGTAAQKAILSMNEAVTEGNENLEVFAETAGMTSDEFVSAWQSDPANAFAAFVNGLGKAGDGATGILKELELTDQRLIAAFLSLAGAGDLVNKTIQTGNQAWSDNSALSEEAAKRYETTAAKLEIFMNNMKDLAITVGDAVLPALNELLPVLNDILGTVGDLLELDLGSIFSRFYENSQEPLKSLGSSIHDQVYELTEAEKATIAHVYAMDKQQAAAWGASNAMTGVAGETEKVTEELDESREAVRGLTDAFDLLFGIRISAERASLRFRDAVKTMTDAVDDSNGSLDVHTQKGRDARSSMLDAVDAAIEEAKALRQDGKSRNEVVRGLRDHIAGLKDEAVQAGANREVVEDYIASLKLTPKQIRTLLVLEGEEKAQSTLDRLKQDLGVLDGWVASALINVSVNRSSSGGNTPTKHAGGVVGSTGASRVGAALRGDEVPIIAQRGEVVLSRAQVRSGDAGGLVIHQQFNVRGTAYAAKELKEMARQGAEEALEGARVQSARHGRTRRAS